MADVAQVLADAPPPVVLPAGAEERKRRNRIAEALLMQGMDTSPVQSWTQGAARVAQSLAGTLEANRLDSDERAGADRLRTLLMANPALGGGGGGAAAPARADTGVTMPSVGAGVPAGDAISSIESGGRYDALGPVIEKTGDRAYGKYQVMGANIPSWTQTHVGRSMTPQEFLSSPQAQDAVFKGQFGNYAQKYGPEGAARAWFAGEGGMNDLSRKDPLGTTVGQYGRRFAAATAGAPTATDAGGAGAPAAAAAAPGVPDSVAAALQPGLPSNAAAPGGLPAAAAVSPGQPAPARNVTPMDPQMRSYVQLLLASRDPQAAAMAQSIIAQYSKPAELKSVTIGTKGYTFNSATGTYTQGPDADKPKFAKFGPSSVLEEGTGKVSEVPGQGFRALTDPAERARYGIAATDTRPYQVGPGGELKNPPPEMQRPDFEHTPDGRILNKHTGEYVTAAQAGFRPLVDPAERAQHGIPADDKRPYQLDSAGKLINPPAETRINIDQKAEGSFENKAGELQATRFNDLVKQGYDAKAMVSDLNALRDIGSRITTGKRAEITAALGPYAEGLGVKIDGLDDLQAFNAIVARLQPRMRVAGSGATSDYEMRTFLQALPSLGKTEGGNAIISNTLESLQQQHLAAANIASQAMDKTITRSQAEKQLRELPDPFELWKKSRGSAPSASQKTSNGVTWSIEGGGGGGAP